MTQKTLSVLGPSVLIFCSLFIWRRFYPATDWAVLALVPLTALLLAGFFWSSAAVYLASMKVAVREGSPIAWLAAGRLRAFLGATVFTLVSMPLLAWYALSSTHTELLLLALLCLFASALYALALHKLLDHLTPPFARTTALWASTLVAFMFVPVIAWANWHFTPHSAEIRFATLHEALQIGIGQLPHRRGWLAEPLSPLYALEYAKLWFVVQEGSPKWFSFWYSFDAALISLVAARACAVLMPLAQIGKGNTGDRNSAS